MKIEFYDKETLEVVNRKDNYLVDENGVVWSQCDYDYEMLIQHEDVGWRVVE